MQKREYIPGVEDVMPHAHELPEGQRSLGRSVDGNGECLKVAHKIVVQENR